MRRRTTAALATLAAAVALGACGDDQGSDSSELNQERPEQTDNPPDQTERGDE